ncbi:MAG: hypothetical protein R3304_12895 [Longimicrobiales bacterium]|nr:hypothetical protein [Longimicrobiales bacterium]
MRRRRLEVGMIMLLVAGVGCGGGPDVTEVEPDPAIQPFVGTWDAETMTVTSVADTSIVADLIDAGGAFTLNVQESGQYTAQLSFAATDSAGIEPFVEIGRMTVFDDFITLSPTTPPGDPVSSEYEFVEDDFLRLEGPTDFDFNLDGTTDPAVLLLELRRR